MIIHPIKPLYSQNSEILILGSFPSIKSREQMFYYSHPQNRFWRVLAAIFELPIPETIDEKRELILSHNLALWDVLASCEISGSADSSIKNAIANDLSEILNNSKVKKIFVNGKTAEKYYIKYLEPKYKIKAICLPSTSPANATYSLDKLINEWNIIKNSN
ncbi:MAG: DNA-deoxyinosine glycosylase [Clostridia bacterium]|nr:DNA-deoxyinosine glycosylase [Clostridia bacterium]